MEALLAALSRHSHAAELFLVGGAVRDLLEGRKSTKDIDLMVTNITYEEVGQVLDLLSDDKALGIREITSAGKHFPVYKISTDWLHIPIDVALARAEKSTGRGHRDFEVTTLGIQACEDASRRDFTMNAIMFRFELKDGHADGSIVDYHNGIESLARREIRAVGNPDDRFMEDPLRMLRAIRQKNERTGFTIEKNTWDAICSAMPRLISTISPERIAEELVRSLKGNPIETYLDWKSSGALAMLMPEIANLSHAEHEALIKRFEYLPYFGKKHEITPVLLICCLLCDIALNECEMKTKRGSEKLTKGRNRFLHDFREAAFYNLNTPEDIARRMCLPGLKEIRNILDDFVRLIHYKQLNHRRAVAEKILSGNPLAQQILILYRAYQKAILQKKVDFDFLMDKFMAVPHRVTGQDFLDRGFLPGSHMRFILEAVRDRELWDEIKAKEEGIEYGEELFREQILIFDSHIRKLKLFLQQNIEKLPEDELAVRIGRELGSEIEELFFADCLKLLHLYQQEDLMRYTFRELHNLFRIQGSEPHYYFGNYYEATVRSLHLLLEEEPEIPHCVLLALALLDIGKVDASAGKSMKNHARRGAEMAGDICERLGFEASLRHDVPFIIRHHSIFSSRNFERDIVPLVQRTGDDLIHNFILVCYYSMLGRFDLTGVYRNRKLELKRQIQWINKNRAFWKREYIRALEK